MIEIISNIYSDYSGGTLEITQRKLENWQICGD